MKYRVIKDNFLWKKDAILHFNKDLGSRGGYCTYEQDYQQTNVGDGYISASIVENNPEWFEPIEDTVWAKFAEKVEAAKRELSRRMRAEWRREK